MLFGDALFGDTSSNIDGRLLDRSSPCWLDGRLLDRIPLESSSPLSLNLVNAFEF